MPPPEQRIAPAKPALDIEGGLDGPLRASPRNRIAPAQPALERRLLPHAPSTGRAPAARVTRRGLWGSSHHGRRRTGHPRSRSHSLTAVSSSRGAGRGLRTHPPGPRRVTRAVTGVPRLRIWYHSALLPVSEGHPQWARGPLRHQRAKREFWTWPTVPILSGNPDRREPLPLPGPSIGLERSSSEAKRAAGSSSRCWRRTSTS